jgi:hypothetical protein
MNRGYLVEEKIFNKEDNKTIFKSRKIGFLRLSLYSLGGIDSKLQDGSVPIACHPF